ncbi:MAG: DNA methyltransferase [Verrucomicrobiota bacterium]|nr:DNA methyltransferase [Verrucomicrobiota bacterium]
MLYSMKEVATDCGISEEELERCINKYNIPLKRKKINTKGIQTLFSFAKFEDNRLSDAMNNKSVSFNYTYEDKTISIYKDDAISFLKKLPSRSIDLITTDPAYSGMNNKLKLGKGRIVGKYANKGQNNAKWFEEFKDSKENYAKFLSECKRVLKKTTGHIYIMFDSYSLLSLGNIVRDYFDVKNLITWDKVNIGMGHYYRRRHEYILFATNGNTRKIRNRKFPDVWNFKRIHNSKYPTQKPVEVFQAMIYASAQKNFVVCDPFLGSASSVIATIKNQCNFIGCDISDKSIEISDKRISQFIEKQEDILQPKSSAVENKVFWE